jgi:transcription initiation factor TFIIF subunit alpha
MTTKDLLKKFKTKKTGLTSEQTVQQIAAILKKIVPEQKMIKGKLYLA